MPKFKVGDLVRDKEFTEVHKITMAIRDNAGIMCYYVKNISGPGAYGGTELWEEDDLVACDPGDRKLKHMPATPMTQEEMQEQCKLVSKLAECDPGEENDG